MSATELSSSKNTSLRYTKSSTASSKQTSTSPVESASHSSRLKMIRIPESIYRLCSLTAKTAEWKRVER